MALGDVAAGLGVPVFPCGGDKRPVIATGFKAATSDPAAILRAFATPAAEMIGMPTGEASGFVVIDVDIKNGARGQEWLTENCDALPTTRTHKTRSGGLHLVFKAPPGAEIRNSASRVAPGIDVRGEGGYVVLPPSPGYQIADNAHPAEMPRWLIRACMRPDPPAPTPYSPPSRDDRTERYAAAALDGECQAVASAGEGTRNDRLNTAAVKLGGLIGSGLLSESMVTAELTRAAVASGLDAREIAATIRSGIAYGRKSPRTPPERERPQTNGVAPELPQPQPQPAKPQLASSTALPLLWFEDIEPVVDARDFVQGVLLEQTGAVIYGESNAGKTFFATDLALHVAAGFPWNGRRVEAGGVIYCVLEGGFGFRNRVFAWKAAHGLDDKQIPFAAVPSTLNLLQTDADTPKLIETIQAAAVRMGVPVKLVVVDTLSRAMAGGDENSPEDMGALVVNMDAIRAETGATVLFVHHCGKDAAKGARGHSLLRAAIDTEIEVVADPESEMKTATVVKQRDLKKGDSYTFTLQVVEVGQNRHSEPVTTCIVKPQIDAAPVKRDKTRRKEADGVAHARMLLGNALSKHGAKLPSGDDYPANTYACNVEHFRDEVYAEMADEPPATKRQAFFRTKKSLLDHGVAASRGAFIWLTRGA